MDLSRIFDEEYCNELLDTSNSKRETKKYIQLAQMFTAIKKVISTNHFKYCVKKINVFEDVSELPFFHDTNTHEAILSNLHEVILYHEQKLITIFYFLLDNIDNLTISQVQTLTDSVKIAIKTFIQERDELCTHALHRIEFLIEKKKFEKLFL
jgi:hypothetical protein